MSPSSAAERYGTLRSPWSRKSFRGFVPFTDVGSPFGAGSLAGVQTHVGKDLEPAGYACSLDVIVDLSQTAIAIGSATALDANVFVAVYARGLRFEIVACQFSLNPTTGFSPTTIPSGGMGGGVCIQDPRSNAFLLRAGIFTAREWGVLIGVQGNAAALPNGFGTVSVNSIAHGVER
jgi:hypothetical protein